MKKCIISFLLALCFYQTLVANNPNSASTMFPKVLGLTVYSGAFQYHHKEMEIMRNHAPWALELTYHIQTQENKHWHKFYGYPNYGVAYLMMDLGHQKILGFNHAIYPFLDFNIFSPTRNSRFTFLVGSGIGYITKQYHKTENFKNTAISTPLNAFINFGLGYSVELNNQLHLTSKFHIAHLSNGSWKKPNSGLNYTLVSLGAQYHFNTHHSADEPLLPIRYSTHQIQATGVITQKEVKGVGGPKYKVGSLAVEYSYALKSHWRGGVIFDIMYDKSNQYILNYRQIPYTSNWQTMKGGVALSTELVFDKLSALFAFGGYIYNLDPSNGRLYQRVGLRYSLTKTTYLHLALKTHWTVADYLELGIGYKFFSHGSK